jgi:hypothetical protein
VEKYCRVGQATNENVVHARGGCMNMPQCYIIRTLPVLFSYLMDSPQNLKHSI